MAKVSDTTMSQEPSEEAPSRVKAASTKALHLPPTPSGTVTNSPENFFSYLTLLSADQWSRTRGYLYRLVPAIRRKPSYIDRFERPITMEYILQHKLGGSGRYQILLNDKDGAGTIMKTVLDLNDHEYPPRYNLYELDLKSDDNRQLIEELKQEGKLSQNGDVVEQKVPESADVANANALRDVALAAMQGRQGQQPGLDAQVFGKMMDMMSNASAKSIEIALSQLKGSDKAGDPMLMMVMNFMMKQLELAEKRHAEPKTSEAESPTFLLMMRMLDAAERRNAQSIEDAKEERRRWEEDRKRTHEADMLERKHNHEKDLEALKQRANAADPLTMVEQVLNLKAKLGGDEPDSRNWKEKLVDEGMQYVPQLLDLGRSIAQGYQRKAAPGQPPASNQTQPPQRPPQQPAPPPAATQTQAPPPGDNPPMPEQTPVDPEVSWLADQFTLYGPHFVEAFRKDPNSGGDVGEMLMQFKPGIHERIARMGAAKIVEAIACLPEMMKDLLASGTPPMLEDFIKDFIDPPEPEDDPDDSLAPAVPISSKKPRAPKEVKP